MIQKTSSKLTALLAFTALAVAATPVFATDNSDAFPTFDSYIKISGQAASITGNDAAYQQRYGQNADHVGAGIEDLHYLHDLNKTTSLTIDGKALTGAEDYLLGFKLVKNEVGSIDVGYQRFRTFYDGVGGFFPGNGQWAPLSQQDLSVDRGKFWAEAKLSREGMPEVTVRYTNETRDGQKDSTSWGGTDNTGLPAVSAANAYSPARKIIPAYMNLSERHQLLEGIVKQTVGKTTFEARVFGDWVNNLDSRIMTNNPGENQQLWYASATNAQKLAKATALSLLTPAQWQQIGNQQSISDYDGVNASTYGLDIHTSTDFTDKITVRTGLAAEHVDNDFTADRPTFTNTPYLVGAVQTNLPLYSDPISNLKGNSTAQIWTGSLAADYKPTQNLTITPGVKIEDRVTKSAADYTNVAAPTVNTTTGALVAAVAPVAMHEISSMNESLIVTDLGVRYTGFHKLALYGGVTDRRVLQGDEIYTKGYNPLLAVPVGNTSYATPREIHDDYKVGANWSQSSVLTLRNEVFYKDHTDTYEGGGALGAITNPLNIGTFYQLDMRYFGNTFTAIVKPVYTWSFTSRYLYQLGQGHTTGYVGTTPQYPSMHSITNNIGETIDWNPIPQIYVQVNADVVFNVIETVYPAGTYAATAATATAIAVPAFNSSNIVQNSQNDYFAGSIIVGSAITPRDDLQFQCSYYRAADSSTDLAQYTQPYGVSASMVTVTVGLKHKLTKNCLVSGKVGYLDSINNTTGGYTSFHGPLAYVSLDYGL